MSGIRQTRPKTVIHMGAGAISIKMQLGDLQHTLQVPPLPEPYWDHKLRAHVTSGAMEAALEHRAKLAAVICEFHGINPRDFEAVAPQVKVVKRRPKVGKVAIVPPIPLITPSLSMGLM